MVHPTSAFLHRHRSAIATTAIVGGIIALVLSLVQPLEYRATMRLLIIQATSPTLDAFTAVKSAEKVGRNLGRIIASASFLDAVVAANRAIDATAFPRVERKRRRAWARMVESSVAPETSVLHVTVYHQRQAQALAIADGIATVLVKETAEYTGSRDLIVRVIDSPLVSRYPVRPNIPLHAVLGLLLGALAGTAVIYLRGSR